MTESRHLTVRLGNLRADCPSFHHLINVAEDAWVATCRCPQLSPGFVPLPHHPSAATWST